MSENGGIDVGLAKQASPKEEIKNNRRKDENTLKYLGGIIPLSIKFYRRNMTVYKVKELMDTTDNPKVYSKARKRYLEGRGISCAFCRYHRNENWKRQNFQRSWKRTSKRKHQYQLKNRRDNGKQRNEGITGS